MIFQSIENIILIGVVFIVHRYLKTKPGLFFPFIGVPFLRLVKKEDQKSEKKMTKKLNLKGKQKVQSFEKGILIGNYDDMSDINYLDDFLQLQFIFTGIVLVYLVKTILFAIVWAAGPGVQNPFMNHVRTYLIKQNFMNYLLVFAIAAFKIKILGYIWKKGGIFSSESKSAILLIALFLIPIFLFSTLYVHKISSEFNTAWSSLRSSMQILFPNSGWISGLVLKKSSKLASDISDSDKYSLVKKKRDYNHTPLNIPLFILCMFNVYILSPAFLKFSKMFNMVLQAIRKDEEKIERLSGKYTQNKKEINNIEKINKQNKSRRKWFLITLIFEMLWLLLLSFDRITSFNLNLLNKEDAPISKTANTNSMTKNSWSYLSVVIFGSINICLGLYSYRMEIKTKYTALFQQLLDYQPRSGIYHQMYKLQLDQVYKDSLRDAFMMAAKSLLPLLYIVLASGLLSRSILLEQVSSKGVQGATDRYVDNLIQLTGSSTFLKTRITQDYSRVFSTVCPLKKVDLIGHKVGFNYAVIPGESLFTKLENQSLGKIIDYLMLKGLPLGVEIIRVIIILTGWSKVIGEIIWTFYLSKVEKM